MLFNSNWTPGNFHCYFIIYTVVETPVMVQEPMYFMYVPFGFTH